MSKQQLQQEIAELQKQLEEKQKALAATPERWEPKGGEWWINYNGIVETAESTRAARNFGAEYATREQAEKAAKAMRAHNRLLAYVAEFAPDYKFVIGSKNYFIYFDIEARDWILSYSHFHNALGVSYMPERVAIELCRKLNSGEVEL